MKNTKGIACKVNNYHITAIAVKDGAPVSITFDAVSIHAPRAGRDVGCYDDSDTIS